MKGRSAALEEVKSAIEKELEPVFQSSSVSVNNGMPENLALAQGIVNWYKNSKSLAQVQQPLSSNQLAEQEIVDSLSNADRTYDAGDFENATVQYRQAAEQGSAAAQYKLGMMFLRGEGNSRNGEKAAKWIRLAAAQGDAEAQNILGEMYNLGDGVPRNPQEAVKWWRLAAEQNFANAQYNLGNVYGDGEFPQDSKKAVKWYRLAAEQGDAEAQLSLGLMYGCGEGVPQDYVLSYMWINIADETTDDKVQKENNISIIKSVAKKMTDNQIAEAQELARKRIANNFKEC